MRQNTPSCIYWCQNIGREYFFQGKSAYVDFTTQLWFNESDRRHELGVHEWGWVHERLFMPEGINNVHALNPIHEPCSYISLWWTILHTPLFCRFIPLIFQKYTKNHHILPLSTFKGSSKIGDLLWLCTNQNRGVRCAFTYAWVHNNKYLRPTSNFSA